MFSSRTDWDLAPTRLPTCLAKQRAAGLRVLDLTETNPTRRGRGSGPCHRDHGCREDSPPVRSGQEGSEDVGEEDEREPLEDAGDLAKRAAAADSARGRVRILGGSP